LEGIKHSILENKEVTWRLKSRAILLREGDNNSKLFQHYANQWKNLNLIWDMKTKDEEWVHSFKYLASEGVQHF